MTGTDVRTEDPLSPALPARVLGARPPAAQAVGTQRTGHLELADRRGADCVLDRSDPAPLQFLGGRPVVVACNRPGTPRPWPTPGRLGLWIPPR